MKDSTSSSLAVLPLCGVNTVARCLAKRFVLSLFVRAQLPSRCLIGGMATVGLLSFLVAFHREWSVGERFVMYVLNVSFFACIMAARRLWVSLLSSVLSDGFLLVCHRRRALRFLPTSSLMCCGTLCASCTVLSRCGVDVHAAACSS